MGPRNSRKKSPNSNKMLKFAIEFNRLMVWVGQQVSRVKATRISLYGRLKQKEGRNAIFRKTQTRFWLKINGIP